MTSSDARRLGEHITASQARYHVMAIRLITGRACSLVVVDSQTGAEQTLMGESDWHRLQAG